MYRKLAFGWFLSVLVTPWMFDLAGGSDLGRATAPLVMLALFANLFAGFWGQSLIAEAGAALSGFKVPQNFDQPWRATDIREFWNRWHISMAKFVTQYVFLPLNLRKVPPKVATIAAFTFMGLWHELRPGYIIWGVSHGVVMAFAPRVTTEASAWVRWTSRLLTLSLVVVLSYVANYAFA
jgi:D-alanyl-lipoteichoic acid acyltransferase DltB (MBOAT superfamily)